jgi:hypothetical protein
VQRKSNRSEQELAMMETHEQHNETSPTGAQTNQQAELKAALENARYAALTSRARTEEANALVDHVMALLPEVTPEKANGTATPKRTRGPYAGTRKQWRRAVEGLLADLLGAHNSDKAKGWVYRSLQTKSFSGNKEVGHRAFKFVVEGLTKVGLMEHKPPVTYWTQGFGEQGPDLARFRRTSRFKATPELLEQSAEHGVIPRDVGQHFMAELPADPLVLRAASIRSEEDGYKVKGPLLPINPTTHTAKLEKEVRDLNTFFDQFALRGGTHRGFVRAFNEGNSEAFRWNKGGRLYSQGDNSFQLLSQEDRLRMTIDGEAVCEIDIKSSFLTIYYASQGERLDLTVNPYAVPLGEGEDAEWVVKRWCTATFGANKQLDRWPSKTVAKYRERTGGELGKDHPISKVRGAAFSAFPLLRRWGQTDQGWADLMFLESKAIITTMTDLMRDHSMPSLSVHDSLIVPASRRALAEEALSARYRWATGATPKLVTRPNWAALPNPA